MMARRGHSRSALRVEIDASVADTVGRLHPELKRQIKRALLDLAQFPEEGKPLTRELVGFRSYKMRRFRIVYRVDLDNELVRVFHVGHRRTVYEEITERLRQNDPPEEQR